MAPPFPYSIPEQDVAVCLRIINKSEVNAGDAGRRHRKREGNWFKT